MLANLNTLKNTSKKKHNNCTRNLNISKKLLLESLCRDLPYGERDQKRHSATLKKQNQRKITTAEASQNQLFQNSCSSQTNVLFFGKFITQKQSSSGCRVTNPQCQNCSTDLQEVRNFHR